MTAIPKKHQERSAQLRRSLHKHAIIAPGAFNALSAMMIEKAGFEAIYLSGAVLSNSVGGVPDVGLMTCDDLEVHALRIAAVTTLPLIADADTGFGDGKTISNTIRRLEAAGISAIHIEDQEFPKRCGHLDGKTLIPPEEMAKKIRLAVQAKQTENFMIIARTDARGVEGFESAITRAQAYLDAGADGIFCEALESRDEFVQFAKKVPTVLLANMTEFGKSPAITHSELESLGYRIVIFPVTLQRIAMKSAEQALAKIKKEGTTKGLLDQMQTRQTLYDLLDYSV